LQMDFVAAVSHELRTPLTVICSAAENIIDGLVDSKQQVTRYGAVIRNQGRQLTALVDQVLLFASTQDARQRYQVRPWNVSEILKSVLSNTAALAERSGITIEHDVPSNLPLVMVDPAAVSQCLQNLIVNAVKFSGQSQWIGVRARLEGSGARSEVQISVQDKGIGISGADLAHIFEPFYRSPDVDAAQIHGTGLGLTLARKIAEAMGGRLTVTSKLGIGSVFTLHLVSAAENAVSPDEALASFNTKE
jgi:signal transduction histidine kinase